MIGTAWTVENVEMCTAAASMASTLDPIIKWSRNDLLLLGPSAPCSFLPTFSLLACLLAAPTAYCTIADDQNRRIQRQNVDRTRTSYPSWLASSLLPPYSSVQLYSCAVISSIGVETQHALHANVDGEPTSQWTHRWTNQFHLTIFK